ncbi:hypothetical protein R84B8_00526 [Treponema sp. R8-4-B8]
MYIYLLIIFSCVLCFIVPFLAMREANKTGKITDADDFTVRKPKTNLIIFILFIVFLLFIYVMSLMSIEDQSQKFTFAFGFLPVLLLFNFIVFICVRWKVKVKDKQITFTPYFGRKKNFGFDNITMVKYGIKLILMKNGSTVQRDYIKAYHEKKTLFFLRDDYPGFRTFVQKLKDESVPIEW